MSFLSSSKYIWSLHDKWLQPKASCDCFCEYKCIFWKPWKFLWTIKWVFWNALKYNLCRILSHSLVPNIAANSDRKNLNQYFWKVLIRVTEKSLIQCTVLHWSFEPDDPSLVVSQLRICRPPLLRSGHLDINDAQCAENKYGRKIQLNLIPYYQSEKLYVQSGLWSLENFVNTN